MKLFFALAISLFWLTSCGRSDSNSATSSVFAELEQGVPTQSKHLLSAFGIVPSSQAGGFVAFYENQVYFSGVVQRLSRNHFRVQGTVGTYEERDGLIKANAKRTTCKAWNSLKGKATVTGTTTGSRLVITLGAKSGVLNRVDLAQLSAPSGGVIINWGCFDELTGNFYSEAWSDVK